MKKFWEIWIEPCDVSIMTIFDLLTSPKYTWVIYQRLSPHVYTI